MKFLKSLPWLIIFLLALACARQTSPTGGPKDTIPPTLINSTPLKGTKNFKGQTVELLFDEMIILNNPKEQIIITPDVQKKYEVKAKKQKVILTFENKLADTTTYSIAFRAAVQDITEKNPVKNLKLAFSTGPFIDSMSISGKVIDPLTTKEIKEVTVAVYQQDTFDIFIDKPVYITQTDDKGIFSIENLKVGSYYIYAIDDKNRNLLADSKNELYGFLPDRIILTAKKTAVIIPLQKLDARPLKLISTRPYNTYFNIKTSKGVKSFKVNSDTGQQLSSSFGEDQTSIKIFKPSTPLDSIKIRFTTYDSTLNSLDTSLYVKFSERKSTPETFNVSPQPFEVLATKGTLSGKIKFNKPLASITFDSINYIIDSLNTISFSKNDVSWDSLLNILTIQKTLDKKLLAKPIEQNRKDNKTKYELSLGEAAFISVENDSSTAQKSIVLRPLQYEETGVLIIKIETKEPHYIVELLDRDFKPIRTVRDQKNITFQDLAPSEYQVRLIVDTNNDGQWTPGNFALKQSAEKTKYYATEKGATLIKLKANFEIGPLLITY